MAEDNGPLAQDGGVSLSSVTAKQRKELLAEVLQAGRARFEADEAELEKLSAEHHAIFLERFRDSISRDDRFTDEEKEKIIKASYEW